MRQTIHTTACRDGTAVAIKAILTKPKARAFHIHTRYSSVTPVCNINNNVSLIITKMEASLNNY